MLTTKRKPAMVGEILLEEFMQPLRLTQGALAEAIILQLFWRGGLIRSSPSRWPTSWHASSGHCSSRAIPTRAVARAIRERRPDDRYAFAIDPHGSRRRQAQRQTMIPMGRNPEARQAVRFNALTARQFDQPLASRTSSRPAVFDRAKRPYI